MCAWVNRVYMFSSKSLKCASTHIRSINEPSARFMDKLLTIESRLERLINCRQNQKQLKRLLNSKSNCERFSNNERLYGMRFGFLSNPFCSRMRGEDGWVSRLPFVRGNRRCLKRSPSSEGRGGPRSRRHAAEGHQLLCVCGFISDQPQTRYNGGPGLR